MNQLSLEEKIDGCETFLRQAAATEEVGSPQADGGSENRRTFPFHFPTSDFPAYLGQVITAIGERLKVFSDILDYKEFFVADENLIYEEKALKSKIKEVPEATTLLTSLRERLATVEPFETAVLDKLVHDFVTEQGIKIGQIIHPLRIAVSGKTVGVGLFEMLAILGRDRCLTRIDRVLAVT